MTAPPSRDAAAPAVPAAAAPWSAEVRATVLLALPLIVTQLGQVAIRTIDTVMLGWLGPEQLAGGALGINFYFPLYLFGLGVGVAVSPMAAQALGARDYRAVRNSVRQGFWAVTLIGLLFGLLMWNAAPLLRGLGQAENSIVLAEAYLRAAVWGLIPSLLVIVLRAFVVAHSRPRAALVVIVAGAVLHAFGDYALMFGNFGFPALGVVGAGISNSLVQWIMLLALLGFTQWDRRFRRYALLAGFWRANWPRFREVLRIGMPIGLTILAESGLFAAAIYVMGVLGTQQLAAHAIALQCAAVAFMVPLGIAQAATVRVGLAAGRGDRPAVGRAGWVALALGAGFSIAPAVVFWFLPHAVIDLFLDLNAAGSLEVAAIAVTFLAVAAVFQLFDGLQIIAAGALRGLKDTRTPMIVALISYWPIGFGACLFLAFPVGLGGVGIWYGLALGLVMVAGLLVARFHRRERFWQASGSVEAPAGAPAGA